MTETKFTPGPWEVLNARKEDWIGRTLEYWTVTAEGHDKWLCASPEWDPEHDEESTANAHLIASAPELYEALDKVMHCKYFVLLSDAVQHEVSAALAKARGES